MNKMRSEKEMFQLILGVAERDDRIRAVYMNGSRTNSTVSKDIFQDYDIVYVVTETASFIKDVDWISHFGELLMKQEPDKMDRSIGKDVDFDRNYGYLMLFKDGNRIDLHIQTKEFMIKTYLNDKLTVPLLDKDNCLPKIPPPTDSDYHVQKPSAEVYFACCNEFWWCLQNVTKGIWRDELPYAKRMYEDTTRVSLDKMVSWWIGMHHDFRLSTGKMGKYFKKYLPEHYWEMYKQTYSDGEYDNVWKSISVSCELFRTLGKQVANSLSYSYPAEDDCNMTNYIKRVQVLTHEKSPTLGVKKKDDNTEVMIHQITEISEHLGELADLLVTVVDDGASINFLPPMEHEEASSYWRNVLKPGVILLVANVNGQIAGTIQLHLEQKPNGIHRAEIAKLITHPKYRRKGIARSLLKKAVELAKQNDRSLLILDTREGDHSNRLYQSFGFIRAGRLPYYAKSADGELEATILYYKEL
ncbi:GNAT family N-acetyltransferase [Evansella tamaricis]|uniref:GNAT family N-acetyltransferase n=1 Tax=Evansella tamaricis TaxID=2069301 RepID=A0ABS6JDT1_9BACI|nr:GNAT family N-acetyltransferase [Evansella tamaricis]